MYKTVKPSPIFHPKLSHQMVIKNEDPFTVSVRYTRRVSSIADRYWFRCSRHRVPVNNSFAEADLTQWSTLLLTHCAKTSQRWSLNCKWETKYASMKVWRGAKFDTTHGVIAAIMQKKTMYWSPFSWAASIACPNFRVDFDTNPCFWSISEDAWALRLVRNSFIVGIVFSFCYHIVPTCTFVELVVFFNFWFVHPSLVRGLEVVWSESGSWDFVNWTGVAVIACISQRHWTKVFDVFVRLLHVLFREFVLHLCSCVSEFCTGNSRRK